MIFPLRTFANPLRSLRFDSCYEEAQATVFERKERKGFAKVRKGKAYPCRIFLVENPIKCSNLKAQRNSN
jgi:hypothetical protein